MPLSLSLSRYQHLSFSAARRPHLVHHGWPSVPSRSFDSFAREREEAIDTRSDCQDRVTTLSRDACVRRRRACFRLSLLASPKSADDESRLLMALLKNDSFDTPFGEHDGVYCVTWREACCFNQ